MIRPLAHSTRQKDLADGVVDLCAPVWLRSSRLRSTRTPTLSEASCLAEREGRRHSRQHVRELGVVMPRLAARPRTLLQFVERWDSARDVASPKNAETVSRWVWSLLPSCGARGRDEGADSGMIFHSGRRFHAGRDVPTFGATRSIASATFSDVRPTGQDDPRMIVERVERFPRRSHGTRTPSPQAVPHQRIDEDGVCRLA